MSIGTSIPEMWPHIQRRPEHDVLSHEVKIFKFCYLQNQHATQLKLVDKVYTHEMDQVNIKEDTELIQFWAQTGGQTDG